MPAGPKLRVAIIGCGNIGRKRAESIARMTPDLELVVCSDVNPDRAASVAALGLGAVAISNWHNAVTRENVDLVVVATTHDFLAPVTLESVSAGKHVIVEKPGGRRVSEIDPLIEAARRSGVYVRVGFNHRYHRAFRKAKELVVANSLGELMFVRGRYGHGGRIGYDREWRSQREVSGGGELIDQGIHLIDLARWFLGDFVSIDGCAPTYYWDMEVEDNGFMLLKNARNNVAFLHASCTEWKNMFSFEVYGRTGKIDIEGLGGSYGTERLAFYKMLPSMGPPETTIWEYPMVDNSWDVELAEFVEDIRNRRSPASSLSDARAALMVVERVYEMSGR